MRRRENRLKSCKMKLRQDMSEESLKHESSKVVNRQHVLRRDKVGKRTLPSREKGEIKVQDVKVMYTNIDEIITKELELEDYIKDKEPKVICLTETKLSCNIDLRVWDGQDTTFGGKTQEQMEVEEND